MAGFEEDGAADTAAAVRARGIALDASLAAGAARTILRSGHARARATALAAAPRAVLRVADALPSVATLAILAA